MTWNDGSLFENKLVAWQTHTARLISKNEILSVEKEINGIKFSLNIDDDINLVPICQNISSTGNAKLIKM